MRMMSALGLISLLVGCASTPEAWSGSAEDGLSPRARAYSHYLAGVVHLREREFEKAADEYRKAVDLYPDSPALLRELTLLYMGLDKYDQAEVICRKALDLTEDDPGLWALLGKIALRNGDYDLMADAFRRTVELKPDDARSYEALVVAEEKSNDLIGLIDVFEELLRLFPDSAEIRYQLALRLARISDLSGSRKHLEKVLELKPDMAEARYLLGVVLLEQDENARAAEELQRFLEAEPASAPGIENLAAALARQGDVTQAIEVLGRVGDTGEATPGHHLERMFLLLRAGRYNEVIAAAPPEGAPIFATILTALARKHRNEPYRSLIESLDAIDGEIDTECAEYLSKLVYLFGEDELGARFAEDLESLRASGPSPLRLELMYARTLMTLERFEAAETVLAMALDAYGGEKWIHYYLAEVYEHLDRPRASEKHLKACLELEPDDPDLLNFLGYLYADADMKLRQAEKLILEALSKDPDSGFYLDSLGWVYYRMGKADKAVEYIRKAILAMDSDDAILRDHLGDAYALKGDMDLALDQWRKAIRLDPTLEEVADKIERHEKKRK